MRRKHLLFPPYLVTLFPLALWVRFFLSHSSGKFWEYPGEKGKEYYLVPLGHSSWSGKIKVFLDDPDHLQVQTEPLLRIIWPCINIFVLLCVEIYSPLVFLGRRCNRTKLFGFNPSPLFNNKVISQPLTGICFQHFNVLNDNIFNIKSLYSTLFCGNLFLEAKLHCFKKNVN